MYFLCFVAIHSPPAFIFSTSKCEAKRRSQFIYVAKQVEASLASTPGPYFLAEYGTVDVVFTPYIERMNASLFYYKGYDMRKEHPRIAAWFDAMEARPVYAATQSDFHTHAHGEPDFAFVEPAEVLSRCFHGLLSFLTGAACRPALLIIRSSTANGWLLSCKR